MALRSTAYPLVTVSRGDQLSETAVASRGGRRVEVGFLKDADSACAVVLSAAARGQCVAWIRNTVRDALDAEQLLRTAGVEPILFHARFTRTDRQRIEQEVLRRLGPESTPEQRHGCVVVGTQVLEQSLDVDFDQMVTDLCPVDLVIQRAGRLRRHRRDAAGARVERADERGAPVLNVVSPEWNPNPASNWLSAALPGTSRVYGAHHQLWATRGVLQRGHITLPQDARELIESVYGNTDVPEGLRAVEARVDGKTLADVDTANFNRLPFAAGYSRTTGVWRDDTISPTRLGDPSHQLRLAVEVSGALVPLHGAGTAWSGSEVSVRLSMVRARADDSQDARIAALEESMPGGGKFGLTLVMGPTPDGFQGRARNGRGNIVQVHYTHARGLSVAAPRDA